MPETTTAVAEVQTPVTPTLPAAIAGFHESPFDARPDHVFSIANSGSHWIAATDSRMLLAVQALNSTTVQAPENTKITAKSIEKLLATPSIAASSVLTTSADSLRTWAGPIPSLALESCDNCGGNGKCKCEQCEALHSCGTCSGTGKEEVYVVRHGILLDAVIDMNRVSRLLAGVEGQCTISLHANPKAEYGPVLKITGTGWTAMMMPMDGGSPKVQASLPSAPVFSAAEEYR